VKRARDLLKLGRLCLCDLVIFPLVL
jgi:hypothetical protein